MNHKFFVYALAVTIISTLASWGSMGESSSTPGGSSWSSQSRGGYSGGYTGGGGHK
ncbi:hypothetical protein [Massilia horti]|uniref:hypothetical protein n=1 Tax=Massilia horti TaxID=2562153 RepID=UPI00142FE012|nr:hypothetical protein [Massilia horti]